MSIILNPRKETTNEAHSTVAFIQMIQKIYSAGKCIGRNEPVVYKNCSVAELIAIEPNIPNTKLEVKYVIAQPPTDTFYLSISIGFIVLHSVELPTLFY